MKMQIGSRETDIDYAIVSYLLPNNFLLPITFTKKTVGSAHDGKKRRTRPQEAAGVML
jgi:hypothetical protein